MQQQQEKVNKMERTLKGITQVVGISFLGPKKIYDTRI